MSHTFPTRPTIELPRAGRRLLGPRLDDALRARRSQRAPFPPGRFDQKTLAALLELSAGTTGAVGDERLRAYPSAGGLYAIELYLLARAPCALRGIYHYAPNRHVLAELGPEPADLSDVLYADGLEHGAPVLLVLTTVFDRIHDKYGERGYRFALLEAGHLAQNLLLVAQSLGLPAVPLGGFAEDALGALLGAAPAVESPVYVIAVGAAP